MTAVAQPSLKAANMKWLVLLAVVDAAVGYDS
jgi:hypothetical protein